MSRYRPIDFATFAALMQDKGFSEITLPGTAEHVWEHAIECPLSTGRYKVRIYSSIDQSGVTREVGGDAIRVQLFDTVRNRPVGDFRRVHRTENALDNTMERAREVYAYVSKHPEHHCTCGSLFVQRTGKRGPFMACTAFPACKNTRPVTQAA